MTLTRNFDIFCLKSLAVEVVVEVIVVVVIVVVKTTLGSRVTTLAKKIQGPQGSSARNLLESFGPRAKTVLFERICLFALCSLPLTREDELDEAGDAKMDPSGWGFDDMINPEGVAQIACCSRCPSVA